MHHFEVSCCFLSWSNVFVVPLCQLRRKMKLWWFLWQGSHSASKFSSMETVDWYNGSIVFTGNDNTIGCANPICHTINWNDFFIPNNTMWTTPGSRVFPKCGFLGVQWFTQREKSSSQQACIVSIREQSEDHPGVWMVFGRGSSRISQKRISLSDSGKCSPDRMRIDAYLHNVMSILISLMWIRLCFYFLHVTCKMLHVARLIGCDFGDEVKCVGTGQVIARCCSNCHLGWQCLWFTRQVSFQISEFSRWKGCI